jgi:hypothetical protein
LEQVPLNADNLAFAVNMASALHAISTFGDSGPAFDWEHCSNAMRRTIGAPDYYFMLARDETGYVGAVCGRVIPFYFSPRMLGVEEAWYVREGTKYRASVAIHLMDGFVNWCLDTKQAVMVQSGDVAGVRSVGVDALYRHMGFTRYGAIYRYMREA